MTDTEQPFDHVTDVLVIGSGGGGMTAALAADAAGLDTLVVEKAPRFGGSTALVTLVDPRRRHLWVANVGDCVAGRSSATLEPRIALASLTNKVSSGGTGSIRKVGKPRPQLYSQREQPR